MALADASFAGAVPRAYHQYLGPLFFVPYARDLAHRLPAAAREDARILEIACGTGILTAELAAAMGGHASLTSTDLNEPMIEVARWLVTSERVHFRVADAASLPFDVSSFDIVACQFGAMFFPDKVAAAREVRRVLEPGGTYLFNVWGTLEENPIARVAHEAVNGLFPSNPVTFYLVPWGYADREQIAADLRGGGFRDVAIETVDLEGCSPSAEQAALGLVQGAPVVHTIRERGTVSVEEVTRAVAAAFAREFGLGEIRVPMRVHVIRAT
jgi:SAM-dependent methyltransferase